MCYRPRAIYDFTVKYLHISREFAPHIVPALQELVVERVIRVLPALRTLLFGAATPGPLASRPVENRLGSLLPHGNSLVTPLLLLAGKGYNLKIETI